MLGSPYELTRSDIGNVKSVWLYDIEQDKEHEFKNERSPKFLKYRLEWILEQNANELQSLFFNNFVDIMVTPQWSLKFPFSAFTEKFTGYRRINHIITTEEERQEEDIIEEGEEINMILLIEKYIEGLNYSEAVKQKLSEVSKRFYQETLRDIEEKRSYESQEN